MKTTISISQANKKILKGMQNDRDFKTMDNLISSLIREESIKHKCANCNEEEVEHPGDWCESCDNPSGDKYA